ncbi:hypothetical protein JW905_16580, partial [bacterium]|nr:hypothetical protein [candidate division CSSED10-310 bacterium]
MRAIEQLNHEGGGNFQGGFFRRHGFMVCGILFMAGNHLLHAYYGEMHVDEGYYHLVPSLVAGGRLPYLDFLWVQPPLYPLVYGTAQHLIGSSLLAGRLLTAAFGFLAVVLAVAAARRRGRTAAKVCIGLLCFNSFQAYYLTIMKLYGLTCVLISAAAFFLMLPYRRMFHVATALCLALATVTRITVLPGLVCYLAMLYLDSRYRRHALACTLATAAVITVLVAPLYFLAPQQTMFGLYDYHLLKESFTLSRQVVHKLDNLVELSRCWFPGMLLSILALGSLCLHPRRTITRLRPPYSPTAMLAVITSAIVAIHMTSQVAYIYRYLVIILPPVSILLGSWVQTRPSPSGSLRSVATSAFIVCCVFQVAAQGVTFLGPFMNGGPIRYLGQVAAEVAAVTPEDKPILTLNNSVAVEAGRRVLKGDEMNVLTYDPAWDEERCRQQHVLNLQMLLNAV